MKVFGKEQMLDIVNPIRAFSWEEQQPEEVRGFVETADMKIDDLKISQILNRDKRPVTAMRERTLLMKEMGWIFDQETVKYDAKRRNSMLLFSALIFLFYSYYWNFVT